MKRTTMKDIARELNISTGTVYRALNNKGRIKEETKRIILEKAQQMNYQPNSVARKFALRNKFNILVIVPDKPEFFWKDVLNGIESAELELSEFGVEIIRHYYHPKVEDDRENIIKVIENNKIDGIVIAPLRFNEITEVIEYVNDLNIPLITFNEDLINKQRLLYYGPDKELSGRMAAELISKFIGGSGDVCIFVGSRGLYTCTQRIKGFCGEVYRYFQDVNILDTYVYTSGHEGELLKEIIKGNSNIKGIYVIDSGIGEFAMELKKMGLKGIVLVGHENPLHAGKMLMEGYISALVCEEKVCQGYYPVKLMYEYLVHGTLPKHKEIYSNMNIIIRENAKYLNHNKYGSGYR